MTPHDVRRRLVREWLHKADADLGLAEHLLTEGAAYPNAISFHSQQAAEKYLKAFLVFCDISFPKTHDLGVLLDLTQPAHADLAESLEDVIVLTPYGVQLRYPGDRPDAMSDEARQAVTLAQKARDAIRDALSLT